MPKIDELTQEKVPLCRENVGYIIRGMRQDPTEDNAYHADCLLPNGDIAGYFYDEDSYDEAGAIKQRKTKGLEGEIVIGEKVKSYYRDTEKAAKFNIISSIVLLKVESCEAQVFHNYWNALINDPPKYNRALNNCSTICYNAFKVAGLLGGLIFPVTPLKLYRSLIKKFDNSKITVKTGYFGVNKGPLIDENTLIIGTNKT